MPYGRWAECFGQTQNLEAGLASSIGTSSLKSSACSPLTASLRKSLLNYLVPTGTPIILIPSPTKMSIMLSTAMPCFFREVFW